MFSLSLRPLINNNKYQIRMQLCDGKAFLPLTEGARSRSWSTNWPNPTSREVKLLSSTLTFEANLLLNTRALGRGAPLFETLGSHKPNLTKSRKLLTLLCNQRKLIIIFFCYRLNYQDMKKMTSKNLKPIYLRLFQAFTICICIRE